MMELLKGITVEQIQALSILIVTGLTGLVSVAEIITRVIPTKDGAGFTKRIGDRIDRLLDLVGMPNKVKPPEPEVKKTDAE